MNNEIMFTLKDLLWIGSLIFAFASGYAWLKFSTNRNKEKAEDQKDEIKEMKLSLKTLEGKCSKMIEEDKAFASFVTLEIFKTKTEHINEVMSDIKGQNNTIINLLTKANK